MLRRVIAGLVLVGMAIGIWLLWPRSEDPTTSLTTVPMASEPSTTGTSSAATTAIDDASTSTTVTDDHLVETVDEAEAILRELWFGWFEGIYNQDEDRIREVVATEEQFGEGIALFDRLSFVARPTPEAISFLAIEILVANQDCLALLVEADVSEFRGAGSTGSAVYILRWRTDRWGLASSWRSPDDLWEADCESLLRPLQ